MRKGQIGYRPLKIEGIEVDSAIHSVKRLLVEERGLSPALKSALEVLLVLVAALLSRLTLTSRNSSKPPSTDPNRRKSDRSGSGDHRPGGQKGRTGVTLEPVADPDEVKVLRIDRNGLPARIGTTRRPVMKPGRSSNSTFHDS
jgi:transposase